MLASVTCVMQFHATAFKPLTLPRSATWREIYLVLRDCLRLRWLPSLELTIIIAVSLRGFRMALFKASLAPGCGFWRMNVATEGFPQAKSLTTWLAGYCIQYCWLRTLRGNLRTNAIISMPTTWRKTTITSHYDGIHMQQNWELVQRSSVNYRLMLP